MVTKCKHNDVKFVTILAESIVKPLIAVFMNCDTVTGISDEIVKGDVFTCPFCEKSFKSSPGMKGHITRMHQVKKESGNNESKGVVETSKAEDENGIKSEANKVVDLLLKEIMALGDDEECIEESTLEDNCESKDRKQYTNKCEVCAFETVASRRYTVIQMMKKHKETCKTSKCTICDFCVMDRVTLKKHMRDQHAISTCSTSPPLKRKRKIVEENHSEPEPMEVADQSIVDLSESLEDMEIENIEEEVLKVRSKLQDERVIEKEKRIEEEEENAKRKREELKKKKQIESKIILEKQKNELKRKKQNSKDAKKKSKKKVIISKTGPKTKVLDEIPNIREVPANCKHLVEEDDVLYVVPGDGCCGPNCASAFLFKDEVYGPSLRKQMNVFFADHWFDKYQYVTQCSEDDPFVRKIGGGGKITFTDPVELVKYFKSPDAASYIWSDSEDLAVIADMYRINIKVITTKGSMDNSPTVNWIRPDVNLEKFAVLPNVELDDMTLLHENDVHFNLVVSRDADLVKHGSLSYRFNIGPLAKERDTLNEVTGNKSELIDVKKELKKCIESKEYIEKEYFDCETELRSKTEEVEKLKVELKDLKQILKLKDDIKEKGLEESVVEKDKIENPWTAKVPKKNQFQKQNVPEKAMGSKVCCSSCSFTCENTFQLVKHANLKHSDQRKEEEFNCNNCDFQGTSKDQLNKHSNWKHAIHSIVCKYCDETFLEKSSLINHNKVKHPQNIAPGMGQVSCTSCSFTCKNTLQLVKHSNLKHSDQRKEEEFNCNNCDFQGTSKDQLNKHFNLKHLVRGGKEKGIVCKNCGESFLEKWSLMRHRKDEHPHTVAHCRNEMDGKCSFTAKMCWWNHEVNKDIQPENIKCFVCNETFESKSTMMKHRKRNHPGLVRKCSLFTQNNCKFENDACWFIHEEEMETEENATEDNFKEACNNKRESDSDFQRVFVNLKPPITEHKKQKVD